MNDGGNLKKNKLILILILVFVVTSLITSVGYVIINSESAEKQVSETKVINLSLKVGDSLGINGDKDKLDFGIVSPGGSSTKSMNITNNHDFDIIVRISKEGNISSLVSVDEKTAMKPGEIKLFYVIARVPSGTPYETTYTGRLKVEFLKK